MPPTPSTPSRARAEAQAGDTTARILVVEDEEPLADTLRYNLEREGYGVSVAADGRRALERFRAEQPSLVILDLMLPGMSGLDVCREIRADSNVPIIIVTAKDSEADKVAGLELGADDYVTKPFSVRELVSRVRANLRRVEPFAPAPDREEVLAGGPVQMDVSRHEVSVRGEAVPMPPKEFELLEAFLRRKGRLLTREFLIEEVWGPDYFGDTRTLDVHVKRLRRKLEEDPHHPAHLLTVRGLGYKFVG
ncbi:MAG TPA: response regulator transcription factor [Actinomycetota bacterium]